MFGDEPVAFLRELRGDCVVRRWNPVSGLVAPYPSMQALEFVANSTDPAAIIPKSGSRPGDKIVITKPLGTGVITTALKRQQADPDSVAAAVDSMKRLNRQAAQAAQAAGVKSMTDVTGFGLLGHAHEMAHLSRVNFRLNADQSVSDKISVQTSAFYSRSQRTR